MASKSKRNRQRKQRQSENKKSLLSQSPDVVVTIATAIPKEGGRENNSHGGSIMNPPEREGYAGGALVQLLKKIIKPLNEAQKSTRPLTRKQAGYAKDMAGAVVVAGGIGYNLDSDEGQSLVEAADAGELDIDILNPDERINPEDFPTYQKDSESAVAFQDAFREAREVRADTFEFEGRTYTADLPVNREQKQEGGSMVVPPEMEATAAPIDTYPNIPPEEMAAAEASQLPDMQMEEDYVDFVMNEALGQEEQMYLMNALEDDPQLSMIFDKVVDTASEFSGSGEVTGPGTGVSDSIPARLSDGEFVMTKKATDQIGADRLQTIMDEAERAYDGGLMRKDEETDLEGDMNKMMISSNQMPSLNVRQR